MTVVGEYQQEDEVASGVEQCVGVMSVDADLWRQRCRAVLGLLTAQKGLDDAHAATAAWAGMLGCFWLFRFGVGGVDGVDWDEWNREQRADACDILGAGLAGEETVVSNAVETLWMNSWISRVMIWYRSGPSIR